MVPPKLYSVRLREEKVFLLVQAYHRKLHTSYSLKLDKLKTDVVEPFRLGFIICK